MAHCEPRGVWSVLVLRHPLASVACTERHENQGIDAALQEFDGAITKDELRAFRVLAAEDFEDAGMAIRRPHGSAHDPGDRMFDAVDDSDPRGIIDF